MRILCNGFGWFDVAAAQAQAQHDVVIVTPEVVLAAWRSGSADWWREIAPDDWAPDVALFCCPEYNLAPPRLADLPCPVALWVGDWYANADAVQALAPQVDLVLADATGVAALRRGGVERVDECCPWTFDPRLHRPDWDVPPARDVGFLGNVNDAIQHDRNRWLARLADLPGDISVHAGTGRHGEDYVRYVQESRITFNRSVTGDVNMRCFEATACGSLVLVDRASLPEVSRWFEPGREVVPYGDDDFEQVVAHYLEHEDERLAIARAGWERVQQHAPAPRLEGLLERLEELAQAGISRPLTHTTAAAGAGAAVQALTLADPAPWEEVEELFDAAEAKSTGDSAVHVNRAALYYTYAGAEADVAPRAVPWASEQLTRALELNPEDAVAMLNRIELARAIGATDAVRAAAEDLAGRIDAGRAHAAPGRLALPLAVTRVRLAWQAALLSGAGVEAQLTRLVLAEACRLAGETHEDPAARARWYARSLACFVTPETRSGHAVALLQSGDGAGALRELEALLDERPLSPDAWPAYAGLLVAMGRATDAREFVDRCCRLAARVEFPGSHVAAQLRDELSETATAA
jgi:tetratricopeptide (TPR) repeat protein